MKIFGKNLKLPDEKELFVYVYISAVWSCSATRILSIEKSGE